MIEKLFYFLSRFIYFPFCQILQEYQNNAALSKTQLFTNNRRISHNHLNR